MKLLEWFKTDEQKTQWSLVFGITVWFLHLNTLNALTSLSCKWGWLSFTIAGTSGLKFVQLLITLVALLLLLGMIYLPWRNWRQFQTDKPIENPQLVQDTDKDRRPLVAAMAMLLNSFLFLFELAFIIPLFTLNACGQA
jgi:hypothetical protein